MPELPEVEALRRAIARRFVGAELVGVEVCWPRLVEPTPVHEFQSALVGARLQSLSRCGKYLIFDFGYWSVLAHLRLDGIFFEPRSSTDRVDAVFHFSNGALGFRDPRHLARWRVRESERIRSSPELDHLGPEPLDRGFTAKKLRELLAHRRVPIKVFLMDQRCIAGMGNIYAAEALYRARIHPARRAHRLNSDEARRLHGAVVGVTRDAVEWCARALRDLRSIERWFEGFEEFVDVYGRRGSPCRRCGQPIRTIRLGGRTSYFCPRCQPRSGSARCRNR